MQISSESSHLRSDLSWPVVRWSLIGLILCAPLMLAIAFWHSRRVHLLAADGSIRRRGRAFSGFKQGVKAAKATRPMSMLSDVFRRYLSDKLSLDGQAISAVDVQRICSGVTISDESKELMKSSLQQLEMAQFGGGGGESNWELLVDQLEKLAHCLEREIKR